MNRKVEGRFFDLSTFFALGLATLLLISMPGGCSDGEESDDDVETEAVAEPTPVPTMEIVDPQPGDIDVAPPSDNGDEDESDEEGSEDGEPAQEEETQNSVYVVQSGDTLYGIAVQFNVTLEALMEVNGMSDANSLQVGQELQIPR